jgi:hypothetical protein
MVISLRNSGCFRKNRLQHALKDTFPVFPFRFKGRDSSVGIALGYGLDDRGSIPGGCWEFFSNPPRPERLWGPGAEVKE